MKGGAGDKDVRVARVCGLGGEATPLCRSRYQRLPNFADFVVARVDGSSRGCAHRISRDKSCGAASSLDPAPMWLEEATIGEAEGSNVVLRQKSSVGAIRLYDNKKLKLQRTFHFSRQPVHCSSYGAARTRRQFARSGISRKGEGERKRGGIKLVWSYKTV